MDLYPAGPGRAATGWVLSIPPAQDTETKDFSAKHSHGDEQIGDAISTRSPTESSTSGTPAPEPLSLPALPTTITPEIVALARALEHDPMRIYDYVRNRIDYVPTYGSILGATGVHYAGRGNDCDQSSLLVALLRESGYEARFQYGYVLYDNTRLGNWVGTAPGPARDLLLRGGVPIVLRNPDQTWVLRVWVLANIDGAWGWLDPAMKDYEDIEPAIADLRAVMDYTPADFLTRAQSGATVTADSVRELHADNIREDLATFSTNLVEHLLEHLPEAGFDDVIGGRRIVERELTDFPIPLPYAVAVEGDVYTWMANPPPSFRHSLYVQHMETGNFHRFDYSEIAGRRLTIFFDGVRSVLAADGIPYLNFNNTPASATFTVRVLIDPVDRDWSDHKFTLTSGESYAITHDLDGVSPRLLAARNELLSKARQQGLAPDSEPVRGEALHLLGQEWTLQSNLLDHIVDRLNATRSLPFHRIGLVAQGAGFYLDMQMLSHTAGSLDGQSDVYHTFRVHSMFGSALEHGVIRQLQDHGTLDAVSTIRMLDLCNSSGTTLFEARADNWSEIRGQLTNYSASTLASFDAVIAQGLELILPQSGALQLDDWVGVGYISHLQQPLSLEIAMYIFGDLELAGGYTSRPAVLDPSRPEWANTQRSPWDPMPPESLDPVDLYSGAFLFDRTDLEVGPGDGPLGLRLTRRYTSADSVVAGPLGHGWSHDYAQRAVVHSGGPAGLGSGGAVNAASAIAFAQVALDLLHPDELGARNWSLVSIVTKWAMDQLIGNAVTVHTETGPATFLLGADGRYHPPAGREMRLVADEPGFSLFDASGGVRHFDDAGRITSWLDANGNEKQFGYDAQGLLAGVTNAFDRGLAFSYDANGRLASTSDGVRTVLYSYDNGNLVNVRDVLGVDWGYGYDAEHRLTEVRRADPDTAAEVSNVYDAFGRVETQTDALGNLFHFRFTGYRNIEELPDGSRNVFLFGPDRLLRAREDTLGRRTEYSYNGIGQLVQLRDRLGDLSVMTYDPRSGRLASLTNALDHVTAWTYAPREGRPDLFDLVRTDFPDGTFEAFTYDAGGNVLTHTDRAGAIWSSTYNARGQVLTTTRPGGGTQSFTYHADGTLASSTDSDRGATLHTYDALGRRTGTLHPDGATEAWTVDALDRVVTHTDRAGGVTVRVHDANGMLTEVRDPIGFTLGYDHDLMGRVTNRVDSIGWLMSTERDPLGRPQAHHTPLGGAIEAAYNVDGAVTNLTRNARAWRWDYDAEGVLTNRICPLGLNVAIESNAMGQPVVVTDPAAAATTLTRDALERVVGVRDALGQETQKVYDGAGRLVAVTNALGGVMEHAYDQDGNLILSRNEDGQETAYGYTPMGRLAELANALGQTTRWHYDTSGRPWRRVNPDGTTLEWTYDAGGRLHRRTDELAHAWTHEYDARGLLTSVTNPAGGVLVYGHHPDRTLHTVSDSDTAARVHRYDEARRLREIEWDDGATVTFEYNGSDERTAFTDALGHTTEFAYDGAGRLISVTDPDAGSVVFAYDVNGRLTNRVDRAGAHTAFEYDAAGRLTAMTDATGVRTAYARDALGRPVSITVGGATWSMDTSHSGVVTNIVTALGRVTTRTPDALNRIVQTRNAAGESELAAYDARGRVTTVTDPGGLATHYAYDARGLLAAVTLPGGQSVAYDWNAIGRLSRITDFNGAQWQLGHTPMGRLETLTDPLERTTAFAYDARGEAASVLWPDGGTLVYTRDLNRNTIRAEYSGGPDLQFVYDALGQVIQAGGVDFVRDAESRIIRTTRHPGCDFDASYDAAGRVQQVGYGPGGFSVTYTYAVGAAGDGRLTRVSDSLTGTQVDFAHDADGRLLTVSLPNGETIAHTWDDADRLVRLQSGDHVDSVLAYNLSGQVTQTTLTAPLLPGSGMASSTASHTYDAASQIVSPGHAHDARGRLTAAPGRSFTWDGASRLTAFNGAALSYDAFGTLLERSANGVTTRLHVNYALPGAPIMAEQCADTNDMLRYYVWTPGGRLLYLIDATDDDAVRFHHFDSNGNTLALTDANGDVTDAYAYDPYGRMLSRTGTSPQPFTFVGAWGVRQEDSDGTLYQMRARYYDATLGRFLSPEPLWPQLMDPKANNPYQYAGTDPIRFSDPSGLFVRDMSLGGGDWANGTPLTTPHAVARQTDPGQGPADPAAWQIPAAVSREPPAPSASTAAHIPAGIHKPLGLTRRSVPPMMRPPPTLIGVSRPDPHWRPPPVIPVPPKGDQINDLRDILTDMAIDYAIDHVTGRVEDWVTDRAVEIAQRELAKRIGERAAAQAIQNLAAKANAAGVLLEGAQAAAQLYQWANMTPQERYQSMSQELSFQIVDAMVNNGGWTAATVNFFGRGVSWLMGD